MIVSSAGIEKATGEYIKLTKGYEQLGNGPEYFLTVSIANELKQLDVNLATNSIRLKTLKQGKDKKTGIQREKYRILPLHADLRDAYMQYLLDMNISTRSEDLLFPLSRQVIDLYLKKMQDKLGYKVHAHKFRHTFAVKAIMDNVPLNVLQQWLGHSSVFTTSIYTQITGMDTSEFMGRVR